MATTGFIDCSKVTDELSKLLSTTQATVGNISSVVDTATQYSNASKSMTVEARRGSRSINDGIASILSKATKSISRLKELFYFGRQDNLQEVMDSMQHGKDNKFTDVISQLCQIINQLEIELPNLKQACASVKQETSSWKVEYRRVLTKPELMNSIGKVSATVLFGTALTVSSYMGIIPSGIGAFFSFAAFITGVIGQRSITRKTYRVIAVLFGVGVLVVQMPMLALALPTEIKRNASENVTSDHDNLLLAFNLTSQRTTSPVTIEAPPLLSGFGGGCLISILGLFSGLLVGYLLRTPEIKQEHNPFEDLDQKMYILEHSISQLSRRLHSLQRALQETDQAYDVRHAETMFKEFDSGHETLTIIKQNLKQIKENFDQVREGLYF